MAGEIASAYVALLPSFKGGAAAISSQLDGPAEAAGRSAGDKAGKSMASAIGGALKVGLTVAGGALVSLGAAGLTAGLKTASGMEQAKIGFTTMLGSGEKADGFLKNLAAFAAKTPFEFPELQTAASSLVSAGVQADKVIPIMTSLGNATSGMGTGAEGVKRATVALQQMNAAGKITGEDLNQLRDAGIPVYDLLAAATGKSKEEVTGLANAGKLGRKELDQLMTALESGKGLERFAGLMDQQSQSLSGLVSTFKDTLNQGLATAVQPLIPLLKEGLGAATEYVAAQMPHLATGLATVAAKAQEMTPQVQAGLTAMKATFNGQDVNADGLVGKFAAVGAGARQLQDIYRVAKTDVELFMTVLSGGDEFDTGEAGMEQIITTAAFLRDAFVQAKTGWADMREAFTFGPEWESHSPLESIAVSARALFDTIKSGDFSPLTETFAKLAPLAQDATASLPAVNSALDTTSKVFGFVADHIDLVVKAMPFLLGAFAAFKVAQAANNVLGRESLIGFALQTTATFAMVGANLALAASNRALAASSGEAAAAENVSMFTRIKNTVATVASTVASVAARVATVAWTAMQWLLNAALTANPIGLVVAGVVLLVGALIYAWNNSETFRDVVLSVWGAIKGFVLAVVNWLITAIPAAWDWIQTTTTTVWNAITGFISERWNFIRNVFQVALSFVQTLVSTVWDFVVSTTRGQWALVSGAISGAWDSIRGFVSGGLDTIKGWLSSAWDNIRATASGAWNGILGAVRYVWDGLIYAISGPVRTVLQWVRDHFVGPLNSILETVGVSFRIPFPDIPGAPSSMPANSAGRYAGGGLIGGFSPNSRADNIPIWATAKEFMIRQWASLRLAKLFPGLLEYMNKYGTLPGFGKGMVPAAHADGGIIRGGVRGYADGGLIGAVSTVARFFTDPLGAVTEAVSSLLNGIGGGMWGDIAAGALRNVIGGIVAKVKEMFAAGNVGAVEYLGAGRVSIGGKLLDATTAGIFQKANAVLGGLSLLQGSWSTSVAASGGTHAGAGVMDTAPVSATWNRAVDVIRMLGAVAWHRHPWQGPWGDHIHSVTPGVPGTAAAALSQLASFRAGGNGLAGGGPDNNGYWRGGEIKRRRVLLADNGTILAPGLNFVQNNTGAAEPLTRIDPPQGRQIVINGNVYSAPLQEVVRELDVRERDELAIAGLTTVVA